MQYEKPSVATSMFDEPEVTDEQLNQPEEDQE